MFSALNFMSRNRQKIDVQELLLSARRVVEVGATDLKLARYLSAKGSQYLGLLTKKALGATAEPQTALAGCLHRYDGPGQMAKNNADVLIIASGLEHHLWSFRAYHHAQYLLWSPQVSVSTLLALVGLLKNVLLKRIEHAGVQTLELEDGSRRTYWALKTTNRKKVATRRYISPALGVEGFFRSLQERQVNYAILRWFEQLPAMEPGEDLDLLVADEDIAVIDELTSELPGLIPCDLYSVSGLPGTDYQNMAYYPPPLAKQILARARWWQNLYRVPSQEDHFLSLAYHAVYHKGGTSGLPTSSTAVWITRQPEHPYTDVLQALARSLDIKVDISMEGLDAYLHSQGWRPPSDTMSRLALNNAWVRQKLSVDLETQDGDHTGLVVFFIRRKALELGVQQDIVELLAAEGFTILGNKVLNERESAHVQEKVRGGNWGKGPYQQSGGEPAMVVVGYDLMPVSPGHELKERYPALDNKRLLVKEKIRDLLNERLPSSKRCNMLHSSDNGAEAIAYLNLTLPHEVDSILAKVKALKQSFVTHMPVVKELSRLGRRAKIELVEYNGKLAVKKTFRPGFERFLERERFVMQELSKKRLEIPPLLDSGDNFIVYPYYRNTLLLNKEIMRSVPLLIPLKVAKQAMEVLQFFYEHNYTLVDFTPTNIIVDRQEGFKIIDFEFLHRYEKRPATLEESYDLAGLPPNFAGDAPHATFRGYKETWEPFVGLDLQTLLHKPSWLQHIMRWRYSLLHLLPRFAGKSILVVSHTFKDKLLVQSRHKRLAPFKTAAKWFIS